MSLKNLVTVKVIKSFLHVLLLSLNSQIALQSGTIVGGEEDSPEWAIRVQKESCRETVLSIDEAYSTADGSNIQIAFIRTLPLVTMQ